MRTCNLYKLFIKTWIDFSHHIKIKWIPPSFNDLVGGVKL
jgi:hypothetical protein